MAVTRPPKAKSRALDSDDKAAEEFIKAGGAPVLAADRDAREKGTAADQAPPAEQKDAKGGQAASDADSDGSKRQDTRTTPRFSIRLDRDTLDEIEAALPAAKALMKMPKHIRLTKSDFVEWCIREGIDRVQKSKKP